MSLIPVIGIFDVGKTNKKLFLFDEKYCKVYEETVQLKETTDEDGDACEDLATLSDWVKISLEKIIRLAGVEVKAINFSAYGASFVHVMKKGKAPLPLYNYLKPYPQNLQNEFYATYGGELKIARETASPVSGNLNSGLQLYRIKKQQPQVFNDILVSLHLPQFLSFLITNKKYSHITSIGCHTSLWNFQTGSYHRWVHEEGVDKKLAPIKNGDEVTEVFYHERRLVAGIGLHDSSAAMLPYLLNFTEPFVLISTGTWCISLNPFNYTALTEEELKNDCLCYIQCHGLPVKANRLFAGYEHEQQVQRLSNYFSTPPDYHEQVSYNAAFIKKLKEHLSFSDAVDRFAPLNLELFNCYEEAYHQLMLNIIEKQVASTKMVLKGTDVKRIFVDGGFSKNSIFMNLMAQAFPGVQVFGASMAQAAAIGAALTIHDNWNSQKIPGDMIKLKSYTVQASERNLFF
jgi:sugar (pentulose or hexulose) kinase